MVRGSDRRLGLHNFEHLGLHNSEHLGLHNLEHLVLSAMVLPEQQPAASHHPAVLSASTLNVQHEVMAHAPVNRVLYLYLY